MSYYTTGQPGAYPYGYAPPSYAQTPGTYNPATYQYAPTAVTGYGTTWPYYSYIPHHLQHQQHQQQQQRPSVARTSSYTPTAATTTVTRPKTTSFATTHTPATYAARDTINAAGGGAGARAAGLGAAGSRRQPTLRGLFTKELRNLMYGFGDDRNPASDTVNVMEDILIEFIIDVCQSSLAPTRKTRLSIEDIRRALSRPADAKKLARMEELLFMQEDIKRARAQFEESDVNQTIAFHG